MTNIQPDRLDRIEALIENFITAAAQQMQETKQITNSNAKAIQALTEDTKNFITATAQQMQETKQITNSNAKAIQALTEDLVTFKLTTEQSFEQARDERQELRNAMLGIANLLSVLDSDRPTILRKLNSLENKVDQILERNNT